MIRYQDSHVSHVIQTQQFELSTLFDWIFPLADRMRLETGENNYLKGSRMISWFEEPSTRTQVSFSMAMSLLGGEVSFSTENASQFSSRAKGESISDTIRILNGYHADLLVGRFAKAGDAAKAAHVSNIPIINAGDGNNQHPTQALLDLYTIFRKFGKIDGLKIALVGDLNNGRTIKSLAYLLGKFGNIRLYFVSPLSMRIGDDIKIYLDKHGISWDEYDNLESVASEVDVIYMTRIQTERGSALTEEELIPGRFSINQKILDLMPADSIITHPLPRQQEIPEYVDSDPRAHYFIQAENGLYVRMALLLMVLRPKMVPMIMKALTAH